MKDATMTVRMSHEIKTRLVRLAEATNRTQSYIVDHAIGDYLSAHEWHVLETKKALDYAESPDAEWVDHESIKSMWIKKLEDYFA